MARGNWFLGLSGGAADEFNLFSGSSPSQSQQDLGAIAGWHRRGSFYLCAVGGGLGAVHSVNRGKFLRLEDGLHGSNELFERVERSEFGVPLMAHGALYYGPVGLGALLFGNVNSTLPSVGLAGMLELGSL